VVLLQRKSTSIGAGLGKTTGWVHRANLRAKGVEQVTGVAAYERIDDDGLHVALGENGAQKRLIPVDSVVVCAGQESVRGLADPLEAQGVRVHVVGGADVAAELDAKRAIRQGTEVAARI
jgi:2,4-dienoyl-CoA reductase (NADPH2)